MWVASVPPSFCPRKVTGEVQESPCSDGCFREEVEGRNLDPTRHTIALKQQIPEDRFTSAEPNLPPILRMRTSKAR